MAYIAPKTETTTTNRRKADGYLNLKIKSKALDEQGNPKYVTIQQGIPLYADNKLGRSLLVAAENDPEMVVELVGSVYVMAEESADEVYDF